MGKAKTEDQAADTGKEDHFDSFLPFRAHSCHSCHSWL